VTPTAKTDRLPDDFYLVMERARKCVWQVIFDQMPRTLALPDEPDKHLVSVKVLKFEKSKNGAEPIPLFVFLRYFKKL
jgi:hypothetical protein